MKKTSLALASFLVLAFNSYAADVQISQLVDTPDPATRGGEITYTISLLNANNDTATDVTLAVPLPANTSFISVDDANCAHDGGTPGILNCNFGDITGDGLGSPVTNVDLVIATNGLTANTISLTATVATTSADSNPANDNLTQNTTIDNGADLSVAVVDDIDPIIAGGSYQYTVDVSNLGPNDASNLTITNTLPTNVTFQSATGSGWACGNAGQIVTCTRPSLTNGANAPSVIIDVTATGAVVGTVTNSVTVTSDIKDPDSANNTATENTQVNLGTELTLSKSVATPVIANGTTTFTLRPRNLGPYDADDLSITDTLPTGFNFISATGTGWFCGEAVGTVTCTRSTYTVGATDDITIQTSVPAAGTNVLNSATLTTTTPDQNTANNTGSVVFSVIPDGADLSISKAKSPDPVAVGANMTSVIRVSNGGPSATTGTIQVVDTLSANESYISYAGTNWTCSHLAGVVTCDYALNLSDGQSSSYLSIVTRADGAGNLTNNACVSDVAGQPDNDNSNNCESATAQSTVQIADLAISKSVATVGGVNDVLETNENRITYVLDITNTGEDIADPANAVAEGGVVITDAIPGYVSGDTVINASITGGTQQNFTCSVSSGNVECVLDDGQTFQGSADGGGDDTVQVTITVDRGLFDGSFTNTANVDSRILGENNTANNSSSVAIQVDPVTDVEMQSVVITPATLEAGTVATYVLTFINNGPSSADGVVINHNFAPPATRTYQLLSTTPSQGSCAALAGNSFSCNIGTLTRNQTETITLTVMPGWDGANDAWTMPSTTSISTTTVESNGANNSQTENLNVVKADLDLLVNVTDTSDPVGWTPTPGAFPAALDNIIVYQVDITNRGPSLATGVSLVDVMTPKAGKQLTLLCDDATPTGCTVGTSLCNNLGTSATGPANITTTCSLPDITASSSTTRYLYFRADTAPDSVGDTHNNIATISSNEDDAIPSNDNESETTSVRVLVDLAVDKNPSKASVSLNEPFDWDILVTNNGPGDSANSTLADTLPAGMELTAAPVTAQGSCTGSAGGTAISCALGTINNGDSVAVTVPVRIVTKPAGNTITNTASVTTFGVDSNPANDTDTGTVTIVTSSIMGTVFNDLSDNGRIDSSEHGISGVSLNLSGNDTWGNNVNINVITDTDGNYSFIDLPPSNNYTISETQPSNFDDGLDSQNNIVISSSKITDTINSIVLTADTDLINYNFGELGQSSISGAVWFDESNDGTKDANENTGIAQVTITLSGTETNSGKAVNLVASTDSNGEYHFNHLTQGTYTITESQPNAWGDGLEQLGSIGGTLANDNFSGISLGQSQTATNYNFGELGTAISGYVYRDNNNNAIKDISEQGIAGVRITLTGTSLDNQTVNKTVSSASSGLYQFVGIPASNGTGYKIKETQPAKIVDGKDSLGSLGGTLGNDVFTNVVTPANVIATNYNFGEGQDINSALSGRVYVDKNGDGLFNTNEIGIANVTLTLKGKNNLGNVVFRETTTDVNGQYSFVNLLPSDNDGYSITQTHPVDYSDGFESTNDGIVANSNVSDVLIAIQLATNETLENLNFGELVKSSISGYVFVDANSNGLKEQEEKPLSGVVVNLSGNDYVNTVVSLQATTDINGHYLFANLTPSDNLGYRITQQHPTDYVDGLESKAGAIITGSDSSDMIDNIIIVGNENMEDFNFAEQPKSSLSGFVYLDNNNNGLKEINESALSGVELQLTGFNNKGEAISETTSTDINGLYLFENLFPSDTNGYAITQIHPTNYVDGLESAAGVVILGSAASDTIGSIQLSANQKMTAYNFGEQERSSISGYVYIDSNNNGIKDADESPIGNVSMMLSGVDYLGNTVATTTATDIDGQYLFEALMPSNDEGYTISQIHPTDYVDGLDSADGSVLPESDSSDLITNVVVNANQNIVSHNFGEQERSSISGYVYIDSNNNGFKDTKELPISDVEIQLSGIDSLGTPVTLITQTNADGYYEFSKLLPSSADGYSIKQTHPIDYIDGFESIGEDKIANSDNSDTIENIAILAATALAQHNFGEQETASLSGTVWVDEDDDGAMHASEQLRIAGVTISLKGTISGQNSTENNYSLSTKTDEHGNYLFSGLRPGTYQITQTQPIAWMDGKDHLGNIGGEKANDSFTNIIVAPADVGTEYNFGERGSELAGTVYSDLNDNAVKDNNEAGIPAVEIELTGIDLDGNAVKRVLLTNITGDYVFEHLPLNNKQGFAIAETQPENTIDGQETLGSLGGEQENDLFTQVSINQHFTRGQGYNFGEILENPASISGFVWLDSNHNRAEDDGKGLSGWKVELLESRADVKNNENYTLIATVYSEADGSYLFEGLSQGLYEVRFIHPEGGVIYGYPVSDYVGVDLTGGTIRNINLPVGEHIPEQNLPIDPSGIVYNSKTRAPVPGATVEISGPSGFDPDRDLVGGSNNVTQITASDGLYQYLLFTSAPSGTYTLSVTEPAGYIPGVSTIIPACTNTAIINATPNPALVQAKDVPPAIDAPIHQADACPINSEGFASSEHTTQYYLSFEIDPQLPSANVVNNHIPLDQYDNETLQVIKTSRVKYVNRGDIVPYTITVTNSLNTTLENLSVIDQLPAGFKYVESSAKINELPVEPSIVGNTLTWTPVTFAANEQKQIKLLAIVGTGVVEGEHTNQAWANAEVTTDTIANIGKATVILTSDPIFDCSDITGKVFDDTNINGYQDEGEQGLANVRIATARGQLITTDSNGRYHIACAEVPNELRGSNFILKIDDRTLPSGYRITTENPRVTRLTRGKVNKVNFGAALHRIVRVQLTNHAFSGDELANNYQEGLRKAVKALQVKPSVLRIAYLQNEEDGELVNKRLDHIKQLVEQQWQQCDCAYPLAIETEITSTKAADKHALGGK